MKVLAGLYAPELGRLVLDGLAVHEDTRQRYREHIAAVLSDYHLFRRLYGISDPDQATVERLLTQFELQQKTHLVDGEFNTIELSAGQRKRLALLVGLLEQRPILLLDEWTANQDPGYRRKFYHELVPTLHASGLTMVIVTHDDRYVDELKLPARRLRMDEGRFV